MIQLLNEKLEAIYNLKNYTNEIMSLSSNIDDDKISLMIVERKNYIDAINSINTEIDKYLKYNSNHKETNEIKILKNTIRESITEIINMDKEIRKHINAELKSLKSKLNQPETTSRLINIKI